MLSAAAAGAGVAVGMVAGADPAVAANGGSVILGAANKASAETSITSKKSTAVAGTSDLANASVDTGVGVYGTSASGYGVRGDSSGLYAGVGGYASGPGGSGVYGLGEGTNGYGVYGQATDGYAVYADGNASVTGTLSKGGGSFRIDHPVDPEGKYLYHSFVESPDMMNVYNGTVVLNRKGKATVELPDWFEALNSDFRYQLTAIGKPAPKLHVSAEIENGTFAIAGGKSGQRISWQVTGVRHDAWANAYRIPVEVDKPQEDLGRYLHPELFDGDPVHEILRPPAPLRPWVERESA